MSKLSTMLKINPEHTTAHARCYSGDLRQLVNHSDGNKNYKAHDYVNIKTLKGFLIEEGFITEIEYPFVGGTNGSNYWLFSPSIDKHRKKLAEKTKDDFFCYLPADPLLVGEDECGLVTSAFVVTQKKYPVGLLYNPTKPEDFTPKSILRVQTIVQFKPGILRSYTDERFSDGDENKHVNTVLTDIRRGFYEDTDELTQLRTDFGGCIYSGLEGVTLRAADYKTHRWAQKNVLPAVKAILDNPAAREAILIREELSNIKFPTSNYGHNDKIRVRKTIAKEQEKAHKAMEDKFYKPTLESAIHELKQNPQVVRALKLM